MLTKKRLNLKFTETIYYLQSVKNTIDTDLAQKSIQGDLKKIDLEAEHNWVLYSKVPWGGYSKNKFKKRKEEFQTKALPVECKKGKGGDLQEFLRRWQNSWMAAKRFREHIRIFKVLKPGTSPGQTERMIRMNTTGRR